MAANAAGAFTGMHLNIDEILTAGDKLVVRFTNSGTQTGPFLGQPATGKHAAWFGEDILGMLIQLGAIQLPAS